LIEFYHVLRVKRKAARAIRQILRSCGTKCSASAAITKRDEYCQRDSRFRPESGKPAFAGCSEQYRQFAVDRPAAGRTAPFAGDNGMVAGPNVDLANELVQLLVARYTFAANAQVIRADAQMSASLLNITA
jgi:hypothetical protein